ncbi:2Fe-2S iron-sulfur cluster-binding protein [Paracoccus siganidrum]|uniref:nitric oxide dioxygenase n=1 Tax=Paracoccus siganidrum TaxID=1276757 RepID=A0A419ABD2_9RHOB|nr:2Fe-2S iron-sulfur cluster-binding protein [Paracoccus siganidrum]RJL20757.1 oxidoreductase [Paracoccus siganidrum]RMC31934.1 oxidoreductase [Paracoccus siganidrum]
MADPFRRFRLARKVPESACITSFHLVPEDGGPLWDMRPGQYLTLRIPAPSGPVLRTYSLSALPEGRDHHRISVKREPQGLGSRWLHDHLAEGEVIEIAAPRGGFVLAEASARPVLLLAGGVGLTPLLAMLHRLAAGERRAFFVQAAENGDVHALRDEVAALAAGSGGRIVARTVYRAPTGADRAARRFDAEGVVDRAFLQALLPLDDYEVYLCGPTPFMVAMWRLLTGLGVAPTRIAYEFFGKGGSLAALAAEPVPPVHGNRIPAQAPKSLTKLEFLTDPDALGLPDALPGTVAEAAPVGAGGEVVFARSGLTLPWNGASRTILELAEAAGLEPEFSCREGICNTCRCTIREGAVDYVADPLHPPGPGQALICCSRPAGRVVLDL